MNNDFNNENNVGYTKDVDNDPLSNAGSDGENTETQGASAKQPEVKEPTVEDSEVGTDPIIVETEAQPITGEIETQIGQQPVEGNQSPIQNAGTMPPNDTGNTSSQIPVNPPRKKMPLVGIIIAVICLLALGGGIVYAIIGNSKSDKEIVMEAFAEIFMPDKETYIEKVIGFGETRKSLSSKSYTLGFGLQVDDTLLAELEMLKGTYLNYSMNKDVDSNRFNMYMDLGLSGAELFSGKVYLDAESIMLALPSYIDDVLSWNYKENSEEDFNHSALVTEMVTDTETLLSLQKTIQRIYDMVFLDKEDTADSEPTDITTSLNEAFETFKDSMEVTSLGKKAVTINDAESKYKTYEVLISKETFVTYINSVIATILTGEQFKENFITAYREAGESYAALGFDEGADAEEAWIQFTEIIESGRTTIIKLIQDATITLYLDSNDHPVCMDLNMTLRNPETESDALLAAKIIFEGGDYLYQKYDANFSVSVDEESIGAAITKNEEVKDKLLTSGTNITLLENEIERVNLDIKTNFDSSSLAYDTEIKGTVDAYMNASVLVEGSFAGSEKGKTFTVTADNIDISVMGISFATLSGEFYMTPLDGTVEALEGETFDIIKASESEWTTLSEKLGASLEELKYLLEDLLY